MKKLLIAIAFLATQTTQTLAQVIEDAPYYLPKTELRFKLLIEKKTFTPGEFAVYSSRYLRKDAAQQGFQEHRILDIQMYTTAIPDTTKKYNLPIDKKHTIFNVERNHDGILLAINAKPKRTETSIATFKPAKKSKAINPHDYMSEDILKASSTAKMAELTAREIYDIRTSRNELSRGEADYMPKDGEQLKIMLANLDRQEQILTQTFTGAFVTDTIEAEVVFVPEIEQKQMLFRFSKHLGMVDTDDLAGTPYYINIENLHTVAEVKTDVEGMKPSKETGITLCMPSKIKATISEGNHELKSFETYAAQFGEPETISANLFGKKFTTHLQLNPITGNIESMEIEPLE